MSASLVAAIHTRLQLLAVELEEERRHFFSMLVLILVAGVCLGLSLALGTVLLLLAYWDSHRMLVLVILGAVYAALGLLALALAVQRVRCKSSPFAASLGALRVDGRILAGGS